MNFHRAKKTCLRPSAVGRSATLRVADTSDLTFGINIKPFLQLTQGNT
jgi:hypothetical protein